MSHKLCFLGLCGVLAGSGQCSAQPFVNPVSDQRLPGPRDMKKKVVGRGAALGRQAFDRPLKGRRAEGHKFCSARS